MCGSRGSRREDGTPLSLSPWHETARGCDGAASIVAVALALALSSVAKASARACSATLAVLAARDAATE